MVFGCRPKGAVNTGTDWTLGPFVKVDSVNPVLESDMVATFHCPILDTDVQWSDKDVFNPAAVVRFGKVYLLYRAEDKIGKYNGTSRIGLAMSEDGLHFRKLSAPVFYPDRDSMQRYEWEGGCEDPRVIEDERGTYYMTYTAYDGETARLLVATSDDLYSWQKHGLAFEGTKYSLVWSKSGSIVCRLKGSRWVAERINGKYWMYWGDTNMYAATSDDLIRWTPVMLKEGEAQEIPFQILAKPYAGLKPIAGPRRGKFDSQLIEPGPPAMLTDKGILLLYNSRNILAYGDSTLADGCYTAGQLLFDPKDPTKVIKRTDSYFMKPDKPYEIAGQVNQVTFIEGLVKLKNRWFLYYGTADSKIAVAVKEGE